MPPFTEHVHDNAFSVNEVNGNAHTNQETEQPEEEHHNHYRQHHHHHNKLKQLPKLSSSNDNNKLHKEIRTGNNTNSNNNIGNAKNIKTSQYLSDNKESQKTNSTSNNKEQYTVRNNTNIQKSNNNNSNDKEKKEKEVETMRALSLQPTPLHQVAQTRFIPLPPIYEPRNNVLLMLPTNSSQPKESNLNVNGKSNSNNSSNSSNKNNINKKAELQVINEKKKNKNNINKNKNDNKNSNNNKSKEEQKIKKEHSHHSRSRSESVASRKESRRAASHSLRAMLRTEKSPRYYTPLISTIINSEETRRHKRESPKDVTSINNNKLNKNLDKQFSNTHHSHKVKEANQIHQASNVEEYVKSQSEEGKHNEEQKHYESSNNVKEHHHHHHQHNSNASFYRIPVDQLSALTQTELFTAGNIDTANNNTDSDNNQMVHNNNNNKDNKLVEQKQKREQYEQEEEEEKEEQETKKEKKLEDYLFVNLEDDIQLQYDDSSNDYGNDKDEKEQEQEQDKDAREEKKNKVTELRQNHKIKEVDNRKKERGREKEATNNTEKQNTKAKAKRLHFWTTLQFQHNIARAMIKHDNDRLYGLLKKYNKLRAQNKEDARKLFCYTNPLYTPQDHLISQERQERFLTKQNNNKKDEEEQQQRESEEWRQEDRATCNKEEEKEEKKGKRLTRTEFLIEDVDEDTDDNTLFWDNYESWANDERIITTTTDGEDVHSNDNNTTNNSSSSSNNNESHMSSENKMHWKFVHKPVEKFQRSILDRVLDTETGYTLMHLAVLTQDMDCIRICLNYGSEVHRVEDEEGDTPLTLAMKRFPSSVKALFYNGQNVCVNKPLGLHMSSSESSTHIEKEKSEEKHHNSEEETREKERNTFHPQTKKPSLLKRLSSVRNIFHRKSTINNNGNNNNRNSNNEKMNARIWSRELELESHYSQTLVHRAVTADSFTPPWPERLQFIKLLVNEYGVDAGQQDYYGFTPSMWALQHEEYLMPRAEFKSLMRYLNHAARLARYENEVNKVSDLGYDAILRLAGLPEPSVARAVSETASSPLSSYPEHIECKERQNETHEVMHVKKLSSLPLPEHLQTEKGELVNDDNNNNNNNSSNSNNNSNRNGVLEEQCLESPAPNQTSRQQWRLSTIPKENLNCESIRHDVKLPISLESNHSSHKSTLSEKTHVSINMNNKISHANAKHQMDNANSKSRYLKEKSQNVNIKDSNSTSVSSIKCSQAAQSLLTSLQSPLARVLLLLVVFMLHNVEFSLDTSANIVHVYRNEFWFRIINMIFNGWSGSPFFMGFVHLICLLVGVIVIGYYILYMFLCQWLLCHICKIPAFGAQSQCELRFWIHGFGAEEINESMSKPNRSRIFTITFGVLHGILISSLVYNALMHSFWPGQVLWMAIQPTMGTRITNSNSINSIVNKYTEIIFEKQETWSSVTQWRVVWCITLGIDWLAICVLLHMMYEQGILHLYLPSSKYASFANWIDDKRFSLYLWKETKEYREKITQVNDINNGNNSSTREQEQEQQQQQQQEEEQELQSNVSKEVKLKHKFSFKTFTNYFAHARLLPSTLIHQHEKHQQHDRHWCTRSARSTQTFIITTFWLLLFAGEILIAVPFIVVGVTNSAPHLSQEKSVTILSNNHNNNNNNYYNDNTNNNISIHSYTNNINIKKNCIRCCAAILFASINMSLLCIACLQDWNWPTLQSHALLSLPGTFFMVHTSWLLILILWICWTCSLRNLIENWRVLVLTSSPDKQSWSALEHVVDSDTYHINVPAVVIAIIFTLPALLTASFVCVAVASTSLHFVHFPDNINRENDNDNDVLNDEIRQGIQEKKRLSQWQQWRCGMHLFKFDVISPLLELLQYYFAAELQKIMLLENVKKYCNNNNNNNDTTINSKITCKKVNCNYVYTQEDLHVAVTQLLEFLRKNKLFDFSDQSSFAKHVSKRNSNFTNVTIYNNNNNTKFNNNYYNENSDGNHLEAALPLTTTTTTIPSSKLLSSSSSTPWHDNCEEEREQCSEFKQRKERPKHKLEEEMLLSSASSMETLALLTAFETVLPRNNNIPSYNQAREYNAMKKNAMHKEQVLTQVMRKEKEEKQLRELLCTETTQAKINAIRWLIKTRLLYRSYKEQLYHNEMLARGVENNVQYKVLSKLDSYNYNNKYGLQKKKSQVKNITNESKGIYGQTGQPTNYINPRHNEPLLHRVSSLTNQRMLNRKRQYSIRKRERDYLHALDKWRQKEVREKTQEHCFSLNLDK